MSEHEGACVLVVDDDWMNRELLEAYLIQAGYRVKLANNGEKALEMAFDEPPDLVMLDVRMFGIDGFEVCERLRQDPRTQSIPVLMLTALKSEDEQQRAEAVGAAGFITKPYKAPELLAQIEELLRQV